MGQRVNIQYSVELDDLQSEVNRLFSNAIMELDTVLPVGASPVAKLGTDGIDKIESIRHKLAKIDIMLNDIQNIVEGYVRFKTTPAAEREAILEEPPEELQIEGLQDKISKFKELMNEDSNQEPII